VAAVTGFRPKRFDVAGAHPDEAWRAVSETADVVKEMNAQAGGDVRKMDAWLERKPLRFGNAPDVQVQRFLAQGVQLMDGLKAKLPVGLSARQCQVRDRCNELAKSMEKVLAQRTDEPEAFDPWRPVRINVESAAAKEGRALSAGETREKYRLALRGCFPRGPAQAQRSRAAYHVWEENAERLGNNPPVPESAKPWQRFLGVIETMRERASQKGEVWGYVDPVTGMDFKPALTPRPAYQARPRMRM
jgi:hypothetical protein